MKMRTWWPGSILLAVALILAGSSAGAQIQLTNDVAWVKAADEYKGCVEQTYRGAMARLRDLAKNEKAGAWCVVLDVDETVISNVDFQIELQKAGKGYDREMWDAWCQRAVASALPGAKDFCALARELGGKVIMVTNRKNPPLKYATAKNLDGQGIVYDALLMREGAYEKDGGKAARRADIEKGDIKTLSAKLPPLKIAMLVGDQCDDMYPKGTSFETVKDRYAKDLVMLPNPMYGDWATPGIFVDASGIPAPAAGRPAPAPVAGKPAAAPAGGQPVVAPAAPAAPSAGGVLTWQEAMTKIGENVIVEAEIVRVYDPETTGKGGPVKLNVDQDYRTSLTIAYYKKERGGSEAGFGDPVKFLYKKVRVKGTVTDYQGSKQIMLKLPSDIEVVK
jgi:5'-nucleotidase (lipoprotein e(P4) family)